MKNREFSLPPHYLAWEAYGHTNWQSYYDMGMAHAELVAGIIHSNIKPGSISILEWGCGPARVLRHLPQILKFDRLDIHGTDFNKKTIRWCNKNIDGISFAVNSLTPPLAYVSGTFDCIYAISVFTHLSEKMHFVWMKELMRLLKPEGIIIFSTHGDNYCGLLNREEKLSYDAGKLTVRQSPYEGKIYFAAFHPHEFVRNRLLGEYTTISHITDSDTFGLEQDVWVAKK